MKTPSAFLFPTMDQFNQDELIHLYFSTRETALYNNELSDRLLVEILERAHYKTEIEKQTKRKKREKK